MMKSLQVVVNECCQIFAQDFADLLALTPEDVADDHDPDLKARETALDCFLEIAAICCVEAYPWPGLATRFSDSLAEKRLSQKLIRRRQFLQTDCPVLSPFFLFQNGIPSERSLKKVYGMLNNAISSEEQRCDHLLGWMYQYALQGTPEQKHHGQFYTSESIRDYIVSQTFELAEETSLLSPSFSVLDIACGAGGFALRVFEELYRRHTYTQLGSFTLSEHPAAHILENQIFLVDNDPRACRIAAFNLYLKAKRLAPQCQIRRLNIVCADALKRWEHETALASQHKNLFARKYHLVVGNPPYIVINRLQTPKELLKLYTSYQSAAFKINTFALFVERGLELLDHDGILGMIVPNTFLTQVYFEPLRRYILATSRIHAVVDIKRVFERAFVENCIILLQREHDNQRRYTQRIVCQAKSLHKEKEQPYAPVVIPQHHFEHAPFKMFNIHIDEHSYALMEKIAGGNPKLGELCESHDGFNPGNAKAKFIVPQALDLHCKKVLNGKDIGRYWLTWRGLYVRYDKGLLSRDDTIRWGHRDSLESAKILTRQTADRLIGTFEPGNYYATNSIHTTIFRKDVRDFSLKYLLALLNSTLMTWYYRKLISEVGQVFSQVKLINLRQLPIKLVSDAQQQELVALVETLLYLNPQDSSFAVVDARLDYQIYRLYQLTPEEIQIIESH